MTDLTMADRMRANVAAQLRAAVKLLWLLLALALVVILGGVAEYIKQDTLNYWSPQNQCMILTQTVMVAIGAIGMTVIIIAGGIDLSAASVIAVASVVSAWVVREFAPPGASSLAGQEAVWLPLAAMAIGILVGTMAGTINGMLITSLRLVPFIVTLGMMTFARGAAKGIARQQRIDAPVNWISDFTNANVTLANLDWRMGPLNWSGPVSVSTAVLVTIILAVATAVVLSRTRFGRHVFAIGSNEATARLCGVKVEQTKWFIYALAGAMFGLAGVTDFGRLSCGDPTTALGKELDIIAAVVIGGGSLSGGSGSVFGSLIGALLMAHLRNLCVHLGLPNFVQEMVVGVVIVVAVALDRLRQRRRE